MFVHGLRTKQDLFYASLVDLDADVVAQTMTWNGVSHLSSDLFL